MIPTSPHFSAWEVGLACSGGDVPAQYAANAQATLGMLETVRADGGGYPLILSSLYRTLTDEMALSGGVPHDPHLTASAADITPVGIGCTAWARAITAAQDGAFGQVIIYPHTDGHIHMTLPGQPNGEQGQLLCLVGEPGIYAPWDGVSDPPAWASTGYDGATFGAPDTEGGVTIGSAFLVALVAFFVAVVLGVWNLLPELA